MAPVVTNRLFPDAEAGEDGGEEVGGGDVAGDGGEAGDGVAEVVGDEVGRESGGEGVTGVDKFGAGTKQGLTLSLVGDYDVAGLVGGVRPSNAADRRAECVECRTVGYCVRYRIFQRDSINAGKHPQIPRYSLDVGQRIGGHVGFRYYGQQCVTAVEAGCEMRPYFGQDPGCRVLAN